MSIWVWIVEIVFKWLNDDVWTNFSLDIYFFKCLEVVWVLGCSLNDLKKIFIFIFFSCIFDEFDYIWSIIQLNCEFLTNMD